MTPPAATKASPPVGDAQGPNGPRRGGTGLGVPPVIPSLETKLLRYAIVASVVLHSFFIFFHGWKFAPRKLVIEEEPSIAADLFQDIDMTAPPVTAIPDAVKAPEAKVPDNMLPQTTVKMSVVEPKKVEEPEAEEKEVKKEVEAKPAPVEKKAEEVPPQKEDPSNELSKKEALKRLALEKLRQENKIDKEIKAPEKDALAQLADELSKKGNLNKSPGKQINGVRANKYIALLREAIRSNYNLPEVYNLKGSGIKVQLAIEINDAGEVSSLSVQETSGDPAFDSLTMEAVRSSVPLPKPPPDLVGQTFLLNITPQGG